MITILVLWTWVAIPIQITMVKTEVVNAFFSLGFATTGHYCEEIAKETTSNARVCCITCLLKNIQASEGCTEVGYNETDSGCTICILKNIGSVVNGVIYEGAHPFKTMYDGPDIYLNFDENTATGNIIGYKLTGNPINGAGLVTDHFKSGKALYLDGINQSVHIDISHLSTDEYCGQLPMTCTEGISYSIWFRDGPKVTVNYQYARYLKHKGGHNGAFMLKKKHANQFRLGIQGATKIINVSKNRWYHFFVSWRTDIGQKVFVDGSLVSTTNTNTNTGSANNAVWLGDDNGHPEWFGNCWLDNFRIWQKYTDDSQFVLFDMNNF